MVLLKRDRRFFRLEKKERRETSNKLTITYPKAKTKVFRLFLIKMNTWDLKTIICRITEGKGV